MTPARQNESGLTLIELVVSIVLLSMIAGALSAVFVTALNISGTNKERVKQSDDSQTISAFLVRDAQAAGGTDPSTASVDTTLGVSKTDDAACGGTTGLLLRFKWYDRWVDSTGTQQKTAHVADYYQNASQLTRVTCVDGVNGGSPSTPTVLASGVGSVAASCDPVCDRATSADGHTNSNTSISAADGAFTQNDVGSPISGTGIPANTTIRAVASATTATISQAATATATNVVFTVFHPLPDSVSLAITAMPNPPAATYQYTVSASLRPDGQTPPCSVLDDPSCPGDTGTALPLLVLGGGSCSGTNPLGVGVAGNTEVHIYGGVVVDTANSGGCPAMGFNGNPNYTSGSVSILNGGTCSGCPFTTSGFPTQILDPFAGMTPPADTCGTGSNPGTTTVGGVLHYHPGTYPTLLSVGGGAVFDTGNYIFCAGVNFSGSGTVSTASGGVLFYIKGGTLTKSGGIDLGTSTPSAPLSPQTTGPYAGILIWQAAADTTTPMSFQGNGQLALNGTLYAPTIEVILGGTPVTQVRSIVAATVTFTGNHTVEIGVPPPPLVITGPATLPNWTVGVLAYTPTQTVTTSGGSGFNTFTMGTGSPPGLGIDSHSGVISGTPTVPGTYTFSVTDTDSFGSIATRPYTVTISGPPTITTASLPDWTVTFDYHSFPVTATGGTAPYTWSASGLPTGLAINAAGVIVNSPTVVGTYHPTITVTDNAGATTSRSYTVVINPLPTVTGPNSLPNWTAGQTGYPNQQMTRAGGTPSFSWAASGLPNGQSINAGTGVISGTPTTPGTFSVAVTVTDTAGASATKNYSVTINPAPGIATASLPNAEVGQAYNFTLTPTAGGTPPYTWSLTTAPAWLTVNSGTGALSGTPPAPPGTTNVTVRVTDSTGASASKTYTLTIANTVSITGPATLPAWTVNRDYPGTQIVVANGVSPFTWSATGLPPGLSISASGVISGTPTANGTFSATVKVIDSSGAIATKSYSVVINIAPSVSTTSLPNGQVNVGYSAPTMAASGGTAPFTWSANGLAAVGLTISSGGVISGTPTSLGTFSVTITATDTAGATASQTYALTINPPPVNNLSLSDQTGGTSLLSGTTVYYRGSVAGSFTITNVITNASGSGPASSTFANLTGTSTGFTHVGSTVSTPAGGPYVSTTFSWTAGTSSSPTEVVTGADTAGDTASTTLTFVNDSTAPPAPVITMPANGAHYSASTWGGTITGTASDAGSGLASVAVTIQRSSDNNFWNGTIWQAGSSTLTAGGTSSWSQALSAANLTDGVSYTVTAKATDQVGNTSATATSRFTFDQIAGIVVSNITTTPSPALTQSGSVGNYSYSSTGESNNSGNVLVGSVSLVDAAGNPVTTGSAQTIDFALSGSGTVNPAAGTSVLTINAGASTSTAAFTLTRSNGGGKTVTLTATLDGSSLQFTVTLAS